MDRKSMRYLWRRSGSGTYTMDTWTGKYGWESIYAGIYMNISG